MIVVSLLLTLIVVIIIPFLTIFIGTICVLAAMFDRPDHEGTAKDAMPRWWSKVVLAVTGVRVKVHNAERARDGRPHIYVANHMSWYDVPALSSFLPRAKFVAKAELFSLPVFGPAMRAVGMVPIERQNRKAAFGSYDEAAKRVKEGNSIVVFPEGTRGEEYPLRPFKKGPFVLAISAGATVVPILIHGTREAMSRRSWLVRPGRVDVHLLEPVSVEGLGYEHRDVLAVEVRSRIASALQSVYGIESPPQLAATSSAAEPATVNQQSP